MSNELESTAAEAMPEKWVNLEDIADKIEIAKKQVVALLDKAEE